MNAVLVALVTIAVAVLGWEVVVMPAVRRWRYQRYVKGRRSTPR
ncbi:MAG: hypothetical protein ABR518_06160 [Actinomycetota bacterium]